MQGPEEVLAANIGRRFNPTLNKPVSNLVDKTNELKQSAVSRISDLFNGKTPANLNNRQGLPAGVWYSPSTGKYYKKTGMLWKSWNEFATSQNAEKATGGYRRKSRRSRQSRKSRQSRQSRKSRRN
jgi:hypothetical protein